MGETTTKIKLYLFVSFICLMFNLAICCTAFAIDSSNNTVDTGSIDSPVNSTGYNTTLDAVTSTIIGIGTSFLPFISLVNIATLNLIDVPLVLIFYTLVTVILSILQSLLITLIIINMLPFFNA
jgi:hypothetical protein